MTESVVALAAALVRAQETVEQAELVLKEAKATQLRLEREDLPTAMAELGITELRLASGQSILLKSDVDARITDPAALAWLDSNGFGSLIKTSIEVALGREDRGTAAKVVSSLQAIGLQPEVTEGVHPQTLKAFVREQLAAGAAIPFDLFNIHPYQKATIKNK